MGEKELLILVSTLFSGFVGLIVYLWKQKDKQNDDTVKKLDSILEVSHRTETSVSSLKTEVEHALKSISDLQKKEDDLRRLVADMGRDIATLLEFKKNQEKLNK